MWRNYKTRQDHGADTWPVDLDGSEKKSRCALALHRIDINELFYIISDHSNLLLGSSQRKNYKINVSQVYSTD